MCVDFSYRNQRSFQTSHCHDATHPHFIFHPDQNISVQDKCLDVAGKQKHDGAEVIAYNFNGQSNQNGISIVSVFVVLIQANVETFISKNENV
ncbi:hypothetical protein [Acinetobacter sp. YH12134]|uniref:hypothetical protein n=1 Tax=Acinetobacter sp. YH12134 TaxID=2601118 RepID=UPI00359F7579